MLARLVGVGTKVAAINAVGGTALGAAYCLGLSASALAFWLFGIPEMPLPARHYLVVGAVPVLLGVAGGWITWRAHRLAHERHPVDGERQSTRRWVLMSFIALVIVPVAVTLWRNNEAQPLPLVLSSAIFALCLAASVGMALVRLGRESGFSSLNRVGAKTIVMSTALLAFVFTAWTTVLWSGVVLVSFPQQLGGLRPRCARIDLVASGLSDPIRAAVLGSKSDDAVVQSRPLDVYYKTAEVVVVFPRGATGRDLFQVPTSLVRSETSCQ